ncbi:hypothetical protein CIK76_05180 [Glutamicibacter sp. BW80]|nr:hypothetical protein CIK76_05180 [Glutamicibacter sp. BW80]
MLKALENTFMSTPEGGRDIALNKLAFGYGQAVPALHTEADAKRLVREFADSHPNPLSDAEIKTKVTRSVEDGMATPWPIPKGATGSDLEAEVARIKLKREAERLVHEEEAAAQWVAPMGFINTELMAELVKNKTKWCIEGIAKEVSRIAIIAKRKTGKTTLALDLAKSYTQGTPFLGKYEVHNRIEGNVAFLSYDMELADIQQWTVKVGLKERFGTYDLRGQANPFASAIGREWLEEELKSNNVQAVIIDSYGDAFPGQNANDNTEVNNWLLEVYTMFQRAGVLQTVFIAHAGWSGENSRGASTFEDKQDTLINLTSNEAEERFIKIKGRNVGLEKTPLVFDSELHRLALVNVSQDEEQWLREVLDGQPDVKRTELDELWKKSFSTTKGRLTSLIARLEGEGQLEITTGKANRKSYRFTNRKIFVNH